MIRAARRIRLDLAYDGTDFAGFQLQRDQRTVQGVVEQTLRRIQGGRAVGLRGAGRTDSGVHARQQVADCEIRTRLDDASLEHALRRLLPPDVRPLSVRTVAPGFHARKDARSKTYRYSVDLSKHGDPFTARYALHHPHAVDLDRVARALERLPGRRDWSGFAAAACEKTDRVRELTRATIEDGSGDRLVLAFTADGFLQHMVRNLVGTLLEVGGRRMPVERVDDILAGGDRNLAGPTAAARGLSLDRIRYASDDGMT